MTDTNETIYGIRYGLCSDGFFLKQTFSRLSDVINFINNEERKGNEQLVKIQLLSQNEIEQIKILKDGGLITGTAKDIKKGLKEFREKHKDKNYNEYVNMYNENKKETIESDEISQCPKCKCITDTINNKETFEIKDLRIGQQGTYKQFLGNSIDDGRRLLFISFDNDYCAVVTDTEWHSKKEGNLRQLKVTDLFISKQLHDTEIRQLIAEKDMIIDINREKDNKIKELQAEIRLLKENKEWDFKTIKRS
jgi:Zn finger protein HypA/HybF involved in hydrogenase expression